MSEKRTVKEKVLAVLEERKGEHLSGEMLAEGLSVSRAAIWKAIEALRAEGYPISAVTNRGYSLDAESDLLSAQGIRPFLKSELPVHFYSTVESTNKTAKQLALDGAPHGTAVLADSQTGGRGRMGRSFYSPSASGIYLSLILRPAFDISRSVFLTTAASVAVARAVKEVCGAESEIKWVNDVYIDGKKICGILTEAITDFESGQLEAVIVGIGVNCREPEGGFPPELADVVGIVPGVASKNALAASIINQMLELLEDIEDRSFLAEYKARSMVLGRQITVFSRGVPTPGESGVPAVAVDIDSEGGLIVEYEDGRRETLSTGEITIRLNRKESSNK